MIFVNMISYYTQGHLGQSSNLCNYSYMHVWVQVTLSFPECTLKMHGVSTNKRELLRFERNI